MSKSFVRELYGSATSLSLLNPKLAPQGSSPECFVVVNPPATSTCVVGVALTRTDADVPPLAQVELRRDRKIRVVVRGSLVPHRPGRGRLRPPGERRPRVDAVELRNFVPQPADVQAADPFVGAEITLIAASDVVGARRGAPLGVSRINRPPVRSRPSRRSWYRCQRAGSPATLLKRPES